MNIFTIILLIIICYIFWKWWNSGLDKFESQFPTVKIMALIILFSPFWLFDFSYFVMERKYNRVAEKFVKQKVDVSCEKLSEIAFGIGGTQGLAFFDSNKVWMLFGTCFSLYKFSLFSDIKNRYQTTALVVFTHELIHITGVRDEATTECYAIQRAPEVARLLGVSYEKSYSAAKEYFNNQYVMRKNAGDYYWSAECKPGGALDLQLPNPPW